MSVQRRLVIGFTDYRIGSTPVFTANSAVVSRVPNGSIRDRLMSRIFTAQKVMSTRILISGFYPLIFARLPVIVNDLLLSADRGEATVLCLLDLSADFDTVDHQLLLTQLQDRFGVVGKAYDWFQSYLHGRSYSSHTRFLYV